MQPRSKLVGLYWLAMQCFGPFAGLLLRYRQNRGKEDPDRFDERKGIAGIARPAGPLVWMHGASVGEALALLPLAALIRGRGVQVLFTTGTVTSARLMSERLPAGIIHQYLPLDVPRFWQRFLLHWRPGMVIIAESELWPNMLAQTHAAHIPAIIVNGRMSERSATRWLKTPAVARAIFHRIELCLAQTSDDGDRYMQLGASRVQVAGNLKYDAAAPPVNNDEFARMSAQLGSSPVWLAASTHGAEDDIAIRVHDDLLQRWPDLTTIILPRHPARGPQIATLAARYGYAVALRSAGQGLPPGGGIFVADTIGETGLFYRLSGIAFIGRSLAAGGGQNPIEPAKLSTAILHGPDVSNFKDVYQELHARQGAIEVADAEALSKEIDALLADNAKVRALSRAAQQTVERIGGATGRIMLALEPYLMRTRQEQQ
ncbi:MAG: 3-deoxy-D-manno-octulosonic acid transferase [Beijerinckiaceae bacterium]|nr:3-deoxy-D-manno-octulosonic acid transferase [Beijerinckiaceae bacterium]